MPEQPDKRWPYAIARYRANGWTGALPLPASAKTPPPDGFTGRLGAFPSNEDIVDWSQNGYPVGEQGRRLPVEKIGNVGLRLRADVIGIDVDAYGGKEGKHTLEQLEARLGKLPDTWRTTSRWPDDGTSGIRLYRAPAGKAWSNPGPGIEVIHFGWRYAVCWPSRHDKTGRIYCWVDEKSGMVEADVLPVRPDDLPALPATWVEEILKGDADTVNYGVAQDIPEEWLTGGACKKVSGILDAALEAMAHASRHDTAVDATLKLLGRGAQGHGGVTQALEDLHKVFVAGVKADRGGAEGEWQRFVRGAVPRVAVKGSSDPSDPFSQLMSCGGNTCGDPLPPEERAEVVLASREDLVFTATEVLAQIRASARSAMVSPWATLGAVVAQVLADTEPGLQIPEFIGAKASLNFFVALVGPSGSGKSASGAVADSLVGWRTVGLARMAPSSGEGLVSMFVNVTKDGCEQVRTRVLTYVDEIATLGAQQDRQGSTLSATLRTAWSGGEMSQIGAEKTRRRHLDAHSYRLCLIGGVQPTTASVLFNDTGAGTPQRFLWMPALDPKVDPDSPKPPEHWVNVSGPSMLRGEITFPAGVGELIRVQHAARIRGDAQALDGHGLLTRLKLAAGLAVLHGSTVVTDELWAVSGHVMEVSDRTREALVTHQRDEATVKVRHAGRLDAEREDARETARLERAVLRVATKVSKAGEMTNEAVRGLFGGTTAELREDAINLAVARHLVSVEDGAQGRIYRPGKVVAL